MKKKFLAVNVALALGAMVVGSAAYAASANTPLAGLPVTAAPTVGDQSVALPGNVVVSDNHIGIINIVPYYSVQGGNTVALSITNNDQNNGKVVKVRFRGAAWSDDVLDFQVFLSPGDIWNAALTKENGVAKLNWSGDKTVTRPQLDATGALFHADDRVADEEGNTLEGYVEIITLADIPPTLNGASTTIVGAEFGVVTSDAVVGSNSNASEVHTNPLYTVTKHSSTGGAPLAYADTAVYNATIDKLVQDSYWNYPNAGAAVAANFVHTYQTATPAFDQTAGAAGGAVYDGKSQFGASKDRSSDDWLQFPTNGISSYVTVINVQDRKAYTLQATALKNAPVLEGLNDQDDAIAVGFYTTAAVQNGGMYGASTQSYQGAIKAYFTQNDAPVTWDSIGERITADKIFGQTGGGLASLPAYAGLQLNELDLPDLSTPTTAAVAEIIHSTGAAAAAAINPVAGAHYPGGSAAAQRDLVAAALQANGFGFEYVTDLTLNASTDIVVNQPVRRYYYWYTAGTTAAHHREFTNPAGYWTVFGETNTPYAALVGGTNSIQVGGYAFTGREEETVVAPTGGSQWSPKPPTPTLPQNLIGEVSIIAINGVASQPSEALGAVLTKNIAAVGGGYRNGWGYLTTTVAAVAGRPATNGFGFNATTPAQAHALLRNQNWLPYIAYSAINVYNPSSGAVYGTTLPVRVNK